MKTRCFDAILEIPVHKDSFPDKYQIEIKGNKDTATVQVYAQDPKEESKRTYAQVYTSQLFDLYWGDSFVLEVHPNQDIRAKGVVLDPASTKIGRSKTPKKLSYLEGLSLDKKTMLYTVVLHKGIKGLSLTEMNRFALLSASELTELAQELEAARKIKILAFAPLFLLAESSIDFLCESIVAYIKKQHNANPEWIGIPAEQLSNRFHPHPRVLLLALKHLERAQKIKWMEGRIVPADFTLSITAEEEKLVKQMEALVLAGKFQTLAISDLQKQFRLSSEKMDRLLALLVERNKVIQGRDGFLLHSKWLDELIEKLRKSEQKEFSVSDFKTMTGLSRKYAIPLLEWLDQQGVTRRKGSIREIL